MTASLGSAGTACCGWRTKPATSPAATAATRAARRGSAGFAAEARAAALAAGEREHRGDDRAAARRAADAEGAARRLGTVAETDQARARRLVGPAAAVVGYLEPDPAGLAADPHAGRLRLGVPGDVGERLREDVVGGGLDLRGQTFVERRFDLDGDRQARGQRLERPQKPVVREDGGVQPAGDLP